MQTINQHTKSLQLYHGSTGIKGDRIIIEEKWNNNFTLGNGFYTTDNLNAAKLFSHLSLVNDVIRNFEKSSSDPYEKQEPVEWALGKVYTVELENTSILDATENVNPDEMSELLQKIGFTPDFVEGFSAARLSNFDFIVELIRESKPLSGNIYEHATKILGYDALRIKEKQWTTFESYPKNLGLDKEKFKETPDTIVIYNAEKIKSFKEIHALNQVNKPEQNRQRPKRKRGYRM